MTDSTAGDPAPLDTLTDVERESRIEQLLVSGLEEYFAGRLEQAVNVWTRVLFLDRVNDRARAYIDRARRAQAEHQRETESLVHQGLQAFDDGDVDTARRLLTAAVERGAPHEQTLPVLHRIGFLDSATGAAPRVAVPRSARWRRPAPASLNPRPARRVWPWLLAAAAVVAGLIVLWRVGFSPSPVLARAPYEPRQSPLPVPAVSEVHLRRAQALFESGRLPDAMASLDRVDRSDALFAEAQALRASIQRELLRSVEEAGGPPPLETPR